jgi:hypothetical protein
MGLTKVEKNGWSDDFTDDTVVGKLKGVIVGLQDS